MTETARHWDAAYRGGADQVSWYQDEARVSLELIDRLKLALDAPIIDIGGGASPLTADLLDRGHHDLTVLDISRHALDTAREQLEARAEEVTWVHADLRNWHPTGTYQLWHDRAVLHFLTDPQDQRTYTDLLARALVPGGHAIIATFAPDGPARCSGLPVVRYSAENLSALLGTDFDLSEKRHETHQTPSGSIQPFAWIAARRALSMH
jgi:trans-aconitate methyltransferase